jgi:hypothetical protein
MLRNALKHDVGLDWQRRLDVVDNDRLSILLNFILVSGLPLKVGSLECLVYSAHSLLSFKESAVSPMGLMVLYGEPCKVFSCIPDIAMGEIRKG